MKKLYDKNLVENLYSNSYPDYEILLSFLNGDDFEQKHFALTFIKQLQEPVHIEFFIKNVINQDTKIRELASFRLKDFIFNDNSLMKFLDERADIILRIICDVNPQVCRNICSVLHLSQKKSFLIIEILKKSEELIEKTQKIRTKTHKVSKDIFNLYWNFFALENLLDKDFEHTTQLYGLIQSCLNYKDYTIRERAACLTKKLMQSGFMVNEEILSKIRDDENFYVRKTIN